VLNPIRWGYSFCFTRPEMPVPICSIKYIPENDVAEESALASKSRNRTRNVSSLVQKTGFVRLRSYWDGHQAFVEHPEDFWDLQRTFSSMARKRLSDAAPEKVEVLQEEFLNTCRKVHSRGGRLVYPFAAFYVIAQRPSV